MSSSPPHTPIPATTDIVASLTAEQLKALATFPEAVQARLRSSLGNDEGKPRVLQALATFSDRVQNRLVNSRVGDEDGRRKKRRAPGDENDPSGESSYRWIGRNLARSVGPFVRIHTIVEHGVAMALADSDDESPEETVERTRLTESWNIIKNTIPGFAEEMIALGGNRKLRKQVCTEEGLRGARGDDTSALKRAVPDYLAIPSQVSATTEEASTSTPPRTEPPPKIMAQGNKLDRGWENMRTATLNCPVRHKPTEETFALLREGEIDVLGTELPYFLYRDGHVYDPEDMEDGLLEGQALFAVAKHVYQGPSAALKAPGYNRGKAGNAALNGVTSLTGRDVAYVACQLRFALSSQHNWNNMDGTFSYPDFYWTVVDILRGEEGQEILDRFNYKVFGTKAAVKKAIPMAAGPTDVELLEAQHSAKRARKIAAAAAAVSTPQ
ncbi:hypothetical protein C8R44DRAFT_866749 [Mycena epipterygia]|nr:hypothetical protein C8R44DRAFT_866749 [Mycena epipterygia]